MASPPSYRNVYPKEVARLLSSLQSKGIDVNPISMQILLELDIAYLRGQQDGIGRLKKEIQKEEHERK